MISRLAFWGAWILFHGLLRPWFWLRRRWRASRLERLNRRLATQREEAVFFRGPLPYRYLSHPHEYRRGLSNLTPTRGSAGRRGNGLEFHHGAN